MCGATASPYLQPRQEIHMRRQLLLSVSMGCIIRAGAKRVQLGTAEVEAVAGKWHTIRVVHKGGHIECSLNGKPLLDVKDETFKGAGQIGLWTKSDAQTRFAGITLKSE